MNKFHRRENIHLPIFQRMSKPLAKDYRNAAELNPVLMRKKKNLFIVLAICHDLTDGKGFLLDSRTSSLCKNKAGENALWSISSINRSVLTTYSQANSAVMQS